MSADKERELIMEHMVGGAEAILVMGDLDKAFTMLFIKKSIEAGHHHMSKDELNDWTLRNPKEMYKQTVTELISLMRGCCTDKKAKPKLDNIISLIEKEYKLGTEKEGR